MGSHKRQAFKDATLPTIGIFAHAAQIASEVSDQPAPLKLLSAFKPLEAILAKAGISSNQEIQQESVQRQHHPAPTGRQAAEFHQAAKSQHNLLSYKANIMTITQAGVYLVSLDLKPDMIYVMPIEKKHDDDRNWLKKLASAIYLHDQSAKLTQHKAPAMTALSKVQGYQGINISMHPSLWEEKIFEVLTTKSDQSPARNTAPTIS